VCAAQKHNEFERQPSLSGLLHRYEDSAVENKFVNFSNVQFSASHHFFKKASVAGDRFEGFTEA